MSYQFEDIRTHSVAPNTYFLDCNVWLIILNPPTSPTPREQAYLDFQSHVVSSRDASGNRPKIMYNTILLSELFNAHSRIHHRMWVDALPTGTPDTEKSYKKYRVSAEYATMVESFRDDFYAMEELMFHEDLPKSDLDPVEEIMKQFAANTDFNDYYFYLHCYEKQYKLVTDDGDFVFASLDIITANNRLLLL